MHFRELKALFQTFNYFPKVFFPYSASTTWLHCLAWLRIARCRAINFQSLVPGLISKRYGRHWFLPKGMKNCTELSKYRIKFWYAKLWELRRDCRGMTCHNKQTLTGYRYFCECVYKIGKASSDWYITCESCVSDDAIYTRTLCTLWEGNIQTERKLSILSKIDAIVN